MGAVLTQLTEQGEEHPILYPSKKFSEVEKRYCTTEKECASIVFAIKRLHYYLDGNSFLVMTDHNPLVWLNRNGKKQDMLQLAEELGINATLNMTVPSIKIAITNSEGYEEEFVKNLYETIIANGKRLEELERAEKMRLEELERAEKMRLEELERAEKMRLEELERAEKKMKSEELERAEK
ncbi:retrovirus-related Pol polyprotein from transposon 17.6 [Trichonephila clavipes]|nr:retrovirus-related Pol polyprotein from transposon 17.6 [Trichonephila clavipes]